MREGEEGDRFQCVLRPDPAPLRFLGGSAGSGAAHTGKLGEGKAFALCAKGKGVIASSACSGPTPLRCGFWVGSAGPGAAHAGKLRGGRAFARCARGKKVIASSAYSGPTPLRCGFWGAPRDRALRTQVSSARDQVKKGLRGRRGGCIGRLVTQTWKCYAVGQCLELAKVSRHLPSAGTPGRKRVI